jgi:hypothetical protein
MTQPGRVVHTPRFRIERQKVPIRVLFLPTEKERVAFGLHSEVAVHCGASPDAYLCVQ